MQLQSAIKKLSIIEEEYNQEQDYSQLYHGTSLVQFDKMRKNDFVGKNLYVGDSQENITEHYAEQQAIRDTSYPVMLIFNRKKLGEYLIQDMHESEEVIQEGQYYFSGTFKDFLIKAVVYDFDTDEEIELPLNAHDPLPLPFIYGE